MKARHFLMAAGVAIAGWLAVFGDKTPEAGIAEPLPVAAAQKPAASKPAAPVAAAVRKSAVARTGAVVAAVAVNDGSGSPILDLQARDTLIRDGRKANDGALFNRQSWTPPPPPPLKPSEMPPPVAPPLPFAYLGKKLEDGVWEVYLARGESTVIARQSIVIDGKYRVDAIKPPTLSLTYLPLNQVQRLTIGGTD